MKSRTRVGLFVLIVAILTLGFVLVRCFISLGSITGPSSNNPSPQIINEDDISQFGVG